MNTPIKAGDKINFKPEWQDAGDSDIQHVAVDDESQGRVLVMALLGMSINPTQTVHVDWIAR